MIYLPLRGSSRSSRLAPPGQCLRTGLGRPREGCARCHAECPRGLTPPRMYKLILHHVYRSGSPFVDVSGHGNHAKGLNVIWNADGSAAGSGAAAFNGTTSRALVAPHPIWQDLYALRVEALVRFDPIQGTPGHPVRVRRHMIVEGPQSFSVFIGQDRTAVA